MLNQLTGVYHLCTALLYGSGLRVNECLSLRVKDIDLDRREIIIRSGKGDQDRITMLPESIAPELRAHLQMVQAQHQRDLALGPSPGPAAACSRSQVSQCLSGVGLAIRLSRPVD